MLAEKYKEEIDQILKKYPPEQKRAAVLPLLYLAQREEVRDQRDALVGTEAIAFPDTAWVNSAPLTWEDLRGKVVLLEFWTFG